MDGAGGGAVGYIDVEEGVACWLRDADEVGVACGSVCYDMRDALAHGREVGGIGEDKGGAVVGAEEVVEFALSFFHAFGAAEAFEVGHADIGNQAVGRNGILAIAVNLLLMVGAHFDDGELGVFPDG